MSSSDQTGRQQGWDPKIEEKALAAGAKIRRVQQEISKHIVGHTQLIEQVLVCLLCRGHALLEGVPGLGKTFLIKTFGEVLHLSTSRIQFTPDLMPADIIGTNVLMRDDEGNQLIQFQRGPIFSQVVLADEINRATPKTQSAMLEAMQEQTVTVSGETFKLTLPFIVLATQNPIEMEGTYPLPEAQLDRFFFKLKVTYPSRAEEREIMDRHHCRGDGAAGAHPRGGRDHRVPDADTSGSGVPRSERVRGTTGLRDASGQGRDAGRSEEVRQVRVEPTRLAESDPRGEGQRAAQWPVQRGEDVKAVALPSLRHRLILSFQGEAEGVEPDSIVRRILETEPEAK